MGKRDRDQRWEDWVRETLPARHLRQPPGSTLRRALALGSQLEPTTGAAAWLVRLLFDSAGQPLPAGVRGASAGQRRLLYEARTKAGGELQLDLRLRRQRDGSLELTGQLLPPWTGAQVEAAAGRTCKKLVLGDAGEFLVKRLPARAESLSLRIRAASGDELDIADVPLPECKPDDS
jgi:hypothetical protein